MLDYATNSMECVIPPYFWGGQTGDLHVTAVYATIRGMQQGSFR